MFKSILKIIILFLVFISILLGIYSSLIYFNYVSGNIKYIEIIAFIFMIISFFILSLLISNLSQKKGLLIGLLTAIVLTLILFLIGDFKLNLKLPIYVLSSLSGGRIGSSIKRFI